MSQEKISRMGAEHRSNLVAYLDGELDDRAAHEVEEVLANSPVARHEVEMLARTWDMLNVLPTQRATATFSQHTMQKLQQADTKPPPLTERSWYRPLRRSIILGVWCISLAAAVTLGYQITTSWIPDENKQLIDNLPAVQNLDAYRTVETVDFLQNLKNDEGLVERLKERVQRLEKDPKRGSTSGAKK